MNFLAIFYDVYVYDNTIAVDVACFNFHKAFDEVPHRFFLHKVQDHGISSGFVAWMEDWLTGCKQRVVINGNSRYWIDNSSDVPQWSVLAPILFHNIYIYIYINDFDNDEGIISKLSKFPDDTKIANEADSPNQRQILQKTDTFMEWSEKQHMNYNFDKCHALLITNSNPLGNYKIANAHIKSVDSEKKSGNFFQQMFNQVNTALVTEIAHKLIGLTGRSFTSNLTK